MSASRGRLLLCACLVFFLTHTVRADVFSGAGSSIYGGYPGGGTIAIYSIYGGFPGGGYGATGGGNYGFSGGYPGIYPGAAAPFPPAPPLVRPVACSSDGTLVAWWGPDKKTIQLWSVATQKEVCQLQEKAEGVCLTFAPDGKTLASAAGPSVRLWDVATGKEIAQFDPGRYGNPKLLVFAPDGKTLAVAGGPLELWNVATKTRLHQLKGHPSAVTAIAFSPDGKVLISGGEDGTIRRWAVATGKEGSRIGDGLKKVTALALSPEGRTLASASEDRTLRFWDMATSKQIRVSQRDSFQGALTALAFSPDGKTLASLGRGYATMQSSFGNLGGQFGLQGGYGQFGQAGYYPQPPRPQPILWEVATAKERGLLPEGASVAFRDGKSLIVGIKEDKILVPGLATAQSAAALQGRIHTRLQPNPVPAKDGPAPADADALWADLIGADAGRAYAAIWALAGAPEKTLPLLRERVRPAVLPVDPQLIDRWIADLDSEQFAARQKATEKLEGVGRQAEKALREVLKGRPSLEMTRRVERLLIRLQEKGLATEAVRLTRAIEALEQMDAPEARQFLESLAGGLPGAALTSDATAALERLSRRRAP